jgi:hypothetical protein
MCNMLRTSPDLESPCIRDETEEPGVKNVSGRIDDPSPQGIAKHVKPNSDEDSTSVLNVHSHIATFVACPRLIAFSSRHVCIPSPRIFFFLQTRRSERRSPTLPGCFGNERYFILFAPVVPRSTLRPPRSSIIDQGSILLVLVLVLWYEDRSQRMNTPLPVVPKHIVRD